MSGRKSERVFLSLGGNLGDPARAMAKALLLLDADEQTEVGAVSSLYRTAPWGKTDQPDFLNAAAEVFTSRAPHDFLALCLDIERRLKRERKERWGPRLIDIDVLLHGERRIDDDALQLPHPRMKERAFVLLPLAEIAPDLMLDGVNVGDRSKAVVGQGVERMVNGDSWRHLAEFQQKP